MDPGPPAIRALSTDVILHHILDRCDTRTLFYSRLVNQKFFKEATSLLKRKRTLWLKDFEWKVNNFKELHSLAANSKDFPFTGLTLNMEEKDNMFKCLETAAAKRFFTDFGSTFKHLYLRSFVSGREQLEMLLGSYLPNIQTLDLGGFHIRERKAEPKETEPDRMTLPNLRRIKFRPQNEETADSEMIRSTDIEFLLGAAENLEAIEGDLRSTYEGVVMGICDTKSWNKVFSFKLKSYNDSFHRTLFQSIAQAPPSSLTHLGLGGEFGYRDDDPPGLENCISALLTANQSTLECLTLGGCLLEILKLKVKFPRLKRLEVKHNTAFYEDYVEPRTLARQLAMTFPALKEMRLKLDTGNGRGGGSFCCQGIKWKSVQKLELCCGGTVLDGVGENLRLADTFPAVSHVVINFRRGIHDAEEGRAALRQICIAKEFKLLERLEIKGLPLGSRWVPLEEFFTGIPRDICYTLSKWKRQPRWNAGCCGSGWGHGVRLEIGKPYDEIMRPYGGIAKFRGTGLKEIVVWMPEKDEEYESGSAVFFHLVATWYGLDCVPGLKLTAKMRGQSGFLLRGLPSVNVDYMWSRQ